MYINDVPKLKINVHRSRTRFWVERGKINYSDLFIYFFKDRFTCIQLFYVQECRNILMYNLLLMELVHRCVRENFNRNFGCESNILNLPVGNFHELVKMFTLSLSPALARSLLYIQEIRERNRRKVISHLSAAGVFVFKELYFKPKNKRNYISSKKTVNQQ